MGAFRVLLASLHYMGLYMQLSICSRRAGHGQLEDDISGEGTCEIRFRLLLECGEIGEVMLGGIQQSSTRLRG